jgi:hypothetical protein
MRSGARSAPWPSSPATASPSRTTVRICLPSWRDRNGPLTPAARKWLPGSLSAVEGQPLVIPVAVIDMVRRIEASREFDDREPVAVIIAVGNTVVIETGPFEGRSGRVLTVSKPDEQGRPRAASISIGGVPVKVSTGNLRIAA